MWFQAVSFRLNGVKTFNLFQHASLSKRESVPLKLRSTENDGNTDGFFLLRRQAG